MSLFISNYRNNLIKIICVLFVIAVILSVSVSIRAEELVNDMRYYDFNISVPDKSANGKFYSLSGWVGLPSDYVPFFNNQYYSSRSGFTCGDLYFHKVGTSSSDVIVGVGSSDVVYSYGTNIQFLVGTHSGSFSLNDGTDVFISYTCSKEGSNNGNVSCGAYREGELVYTGSCPYIENYYNISDIDFSVIDNQISTVTSPSDFLKKNYSSPQIINVDSNYIDNLHSSQDVFILMDFKEPDIVPVSLSGTCTVNFTVNGLKKSHIISLCNYSPSWSDSQMPDELWENTFFWLNNDLTSIRIYVDGIKRGIEKGLGYSGFVINSFDLSLQYVYENDIVSNSSNYHYDVSTSTLSGSAFDSSVGENVTLPDVTNPNGSGTLTDSTIDFSVGDVFEFFKGLFSSCTDFLGFIGDIFTLILGSTLGRMISISVIFVCAIGILKAVRG